jgi:choline dehydrogenase-like flavoprotein
MGTTRMSADPRAGVVDAQCRVHSVANLYLAGSSVFTTGGHANPTFTLVALALRLADELQRSLTTAAG